MVKFLVSLFILFASAAASFAATCPAGTDTSEKFFSYVEQSKFEVYTLTPEAQKKLTKYMNTIRVANGKELFASTAKFYFAGVSADLVGVVWVDSGCVLAGSVVTLPSVTLSTVFEKVGLTPNDFVKYVQGKPA
jgi:hypothetical protein